MRRVARPRQLIQQLCGGKVHVAHVMDDCRQETLWTYEVISCRFAVANQTGEIENGEPLANSLYGRESCDVCEDDVEEHTNLALASLTLIRGRARSSLSR